MALSKDVVKLIFQNLTLFEQAKFAVALCDVSTAQKLLTGKHYHKLIQNQCVSSILWLARHPVKLRPVKIRQAYRAVAQHGSVQDLDELTNSHLKLPKVPNVMCHAVKGGNIENCKWLMQFHTLSGVRARVLHLASLCIVDVTQRWEMMKFLYTHHVSGKEYDPYDLVNCACRMKDDAFLQRLADHPRGCYSPGYYTKETVEYVMQSEMGFPRLFLIHLYESVFLNHPCDYDLVYRSIRWCANGQATYVCGTLVDYLQCRLHPLDGIELLTKLWDSGHQFDFYLPPGSFRQRGYPDYILKKITESNNRWRRG